MKTQRFGILGFLLLLLTAAPGVSAQPAQAQIEFVATLEAVEPGTGGASVLRMRLTPDFAVRVRTSAATEIRDRNDLPLTIDDLAAGDTLKVEGFFLADAILAREIELTDAADEFELTGALEEVRPASRTIVLLGFPIEVPLTAEIEDAGGQPLQFADLRPGDVVKVEGQAQGGALVARQVKVGAGAPEFARVRFVGTIVEVGPSSILVEMPGAQRVLVEIEPQTVIRGSLVVGAAVEVRGRLTPSLAVAARLIEVLRAVRAIPDEVRMDFGQTRRVDLLLASPRDEATVLRLVSRDPALARVSPSQITIPAGGLTASFEIQSGNREGTTFVDVMLPASLGGGAVSVKVEVESDQPDDNPLPELVEVKWNPRKIESGPTGPRQVSLTLTRTVAQSLTVALFLKEGDPASVSFPSKVVIPAGSRSVALEISIHQLGGRTKIRAQLPSGVGGDTDDLEIDTRDQQAQRLDLRWRPDDLELAPGGRGTVELRIDQPAPFDFEVPIVLRDGDPGVASGVPASVAFRQGESSVRLTIRAGQQEGRVRYRATLPFQLGGRSDDLDVEVER